MKGKQSEMCGLLQWRFEKKAQHIHKTQHIDM